MTATRIKETYDRVVAAPAEKIAPTDAPQ